MKKRPKAKKPRRHEIRMSRAEVLEMIKDDVRDVIDDMVDLALSEERLSELVEKTITETVTRLMRRIDGSIADSVREVMEAWRAGGLIVPEPTEKTDELPAPPSP